MNPADLDYVSLSKILEPYDKKGRSQSATFLNWFLENIFRLDDVAADDAVCDDRQDKGIDGVYIDDVNEQVILLQSKIRQNSSSTLGDTDLKEFKGSLAQFSSPEAIEKLINGNGSAELKKLLSRHDVKGLLQKGYNVHGIFVVNVDGDENARQFLGHNTDITLYDRSRIAAEYVDLDTDPGITGTFEFSCSDIKPLEYAAKSAARLYLFPALATELVTLQGIADGSLFSQNVRLALGNTKVNKDIQATVAESSEHAKFPLFHNGITLICREAKYDGAKLCVADYAVVNGAQSLTTLYKAKARLTSDLRILTRVVETRGDAALVRQITTNSNNQNAIKPRDSKSNHALQTRLKTEFEKEYPGFVYEVKRGERHADSATVITNEEAGRLLLAFDCEEPWSSHQIYKIFDEEYSKIFGRPEVDAHRIVFLYKTMTLIERSLDLFKNKALGRYTIARFFLLYILKLILKLDKAGESILRNPAPIVTNPIKWSIYAGIIEEILKGVVVDLDYEFERDAVSIDYKSDLKSPSKATAIANEVLRTYEKDVARSKATPVSALAAGAEADGEASVLPV